MTDPSRTPYAPTWAIAAASALAVATLAFAVPLPALFAYSDAIVLGAAAALIALGLGLMLPDRLLWSEEARLRHAFMSRHGVAAGRADATLAGLTAAHDAARRLRAADNGFREDLAAEVRRAADRLDAVARVLFYRPDALPRYQALVIRAESVVDALEAHAALRARARDEAVVDEARDLALDALDSLGQGLDATADREIGALLDTIEVNVATAETLLRPNPKGS